MALLTFTPSIGPSPGTTHKPNIKVLSAEFGDGYSQPTPDGINHIKRTVQLRWDGVPYEVMEEIVDFFYRHGATKPFYYRPFGERHTLKWICKEWQHSADGGVLKITATLEQSFTHEV